MNTKEKTVIEPEIINKVKAGLREIVVLSDDKNIRRKADEMLKLFEEEQDNKVNSLQDLIEEKMRETKRSNSQLNVNLYLLYRKLVAEKITEEEALDIFEMYLKEDEYNREVY